MAGRSGWTASAVVSLVLLGIPTVSSAQGATGSSAQSVGRIAAFAPGSIHGTVSDEDGLPVVGAIVSAIGTTTSFAVTDRRGRFELATLSPGPYLVRAHHAGYVAPRPRMIDVRSSAVSASSIALRRAGEAHPVLVAGIGGARAEAAPDDPVGDTGSTATTDGSATDDHSETAWRLRHARRGVLKNATIPADLLADDDSFRTTVFDPVDFLGRAVGPPARLATSFFVDTPFSGQVNLLTTGSFDTPQQLFSSSTLSRGIAYFKVGAPVAGQADWTVRGAFTEADITSWIVAGSYATRVAARHRYDVGLSYSTQRYDGGNPLALREVADGSRNVGTVYGFDTFAITPALTLTYGARYARYDYLQRRGLMSPHLGMTIEPADALRISARLSRRAQAPGAEEFLPPGDTGIWLPPQRTFSSLEPGRPFEAERTTHVAFEVERDIAASTIAIGAFRQQVDGQLVTLFGAELPQQPLAKVGHYFVGNAGDVNAVGCTAAFRTALTHRIHGSVAYSLAKAQLDPADDLHYLILLAPSAVRPSAERIHDVATTIQADVPETSTRVYVLYRVSNAFARAAAAPGEIPSDRPGFDSRFDVQVRQSLPFLDFTNAKWEMLLAVRNFFRETAPDQSVYDELLVVRPPKRIVGGVTLHF
jgi:hypothetical protein